MPKCALFGCLEKTRPCHGVKLRWKDRVKRDMVSLGMFSGWYEAAQDRKLWRNMYSDIVERSVEERIRRENERRRHGPLTGATQELPFYCQQCQRRFRRKEDMSCHKCDSVRSSRRERQPPEQLQCPTCHRYFRRPGDMSRHNCNSSRSPSMRTSAT